MEDFLKLSSKQLLPRPTRLHHIVEDFTTTWDAPLSHVLPLRRFVEAVVDADMRHFFAEDCMALMLTHTDLPPRCKQESLARGRGSLLHDGLDLPKNLEASIDLNV